MGSADLSTFWLLFGRHGATMTLDQLRAEFFPNATIKTMRNKLASRQLPTRTFDVFDTRDVADWWDAHRLPRA